MVLGRAEIRKKDVSSLTPYAPRALLLLAIGLLEEERTLICAIYVHALLPQLCS
jgi:hypothetical protein